MHKVHILASEAQTIYNSTRWPVLALPANPMHFGAYARTVTFMIRVAAVTGQPATCRLRVKFQVGMPTTSGYQYQNPVWHDIDELAIAADVEGGTGWSAFGHTPPTDGGFGVLFDHTDLATRDPANLGLFAKRTISNFGLQVRIVLDWEFSGGNTNPPPGYKATIYAVTGD